MLPSKMAQNDDGVSNFVAVTQAPAGADLPRRSRLCGRGLCAEQARNSGTWRRLAGARGAILKSCRVEIGVCLGRINGRTGDRCSDGDVLLEPLVAVYARSGAMIRDDADRQVQQSITRAQDAGCRMQDAR